MISSRQQKYSNPAMAVIVGLRDMFTTKTVCGTLKEGDRLDGKTVFVDGSSSGLGFAIAVGVARRGANVIMACRSGIPGKGEEVKRLSGNPNIHMIPVDLSDFNAISRLVSQISDPSSLIPHPDIFILNAGIVPSKARQTPQGLEEMFMVNYFSKFVFIRLLLQQGILGIPNSVSRVIFVTSESHRNPEAINWEGFGEYREYGIKKSMELYGYYKLLLVTFARELSRRLNPGNTINTAVFAMCPGPVNSNIAREAPSFFQPLLKIIFGLFFKSPQKAAIPVVYLTASEDMKGKPFDYLFLMSRQEIDEKAADPMNGRKLWELSDALLDKIHP